MRRRAELARFAAPAAFLAGVTIAVLLIRAGLGGGGGATSPTVPTVATRPPAAATTTKRRQRTTGTSTAAAATYTVQRGDTFGSIAARFGTSVQRLEQLNPGVSSNALSVGQRIRVK